jgi:transcriptional regulator with XRE-family HTH domain
MSYVFPTVATFGENLARLRDAAGFKTSKSLADALSVAPSMISRLENDLQGLPETPTLLRLAKVLNASVEDLLDGVDLEYQQMLERRRRADATHAFFETNARDAEAEAVVTGLALTDVERDLLQLFRSVDENARGTIYDVLRGYIERYLVQRQQR